MADGVTKTNVLWRSDAPLNPTKEDMALLQSKGITTLIDLRSAREVSHNPTFLSAAKGFSYHHLPIDEGSEPPDSFEKVPLSYMEIAWAKNLPRVFETIAQAERGAMFFCAAGKDRTGVLSAILLLACGVEKAAVAKDYALSRSYNKLRLEKYLSEHPDIDPRIIVAREESMERFIDLFLERCVDLPHYFAGMGLEREYEIIKRRLTSGLSEV